MNKKQCPVCGQEVEITPVVPVCPGLLDKLPKIQCVVASKMGVNDLQEMGFLMAQYLRDNTPVAFMFGLRAYLMEVE